MSLPWGRCGLVANQASVLFDYQPSWKVLRDALGSRLGALFGPQHGFSGTAQDNMIETGHGTHIASGLPVYSLYSETRAPTESMLSGLDTIVIDLQIVGCRVYTFKYTIAGCLRSAKKFGKRVVVLDRPNPLGGKWVEGAVLRPEAKSFVGEFSIPMRHGLTPGEAAKLFNADIGADLEVVTLEGWEPDKLFGATGLPWVLTSPNLPTLEPVFTYPGTVLFEGTNVSEGRGTGLPFQFIGAPYIRDTAAFITRIKELTGGAKGVYIREAAFEPTSQKWMGKLCEGIQFHVTDPEALCSFNLGLATLRACIEFGGEQFAWRQPPYEYEHRLLPIVLLVGANDAPEKLTAKKFDLTDEYWHHGIGEYIRNVKKFLLYDRTMVFHA